MPATETIPRRESEQIAFLRHLYKVAVTRALPLHNTAAFFARAARSRDGRSDHRAGRRQGGGRHGAGSGNMVACHWAPLRGLACHDLRGGSNAYILSDAMEGESGLQLAKLVGPGV